MVKGRARAKAKDDSSQRALPFEESAVAALAADTASAGSPDRLSVWEPERWPVDSGWADLLAQFLNNPTGRQLGRFITSRLAEGAVIYPPQPFRALELTALSRVRVVILGQDPYHGRGQAHGLAFSVPPGVALPPSLRNIFKELAREASVEAGAATGRAGTLTKNGNLERWAAQGVFLLNTCLTVEDGRPASHANQGWEVLTDMLIEILSTGSSPIAFLLWGGHAQSKRKLINNAKHLILTANHPSPLSALRPPQPFMGCGHFESVNTWLRQHGQKGIAWLEEDPRTVA